MSTMTALLKRDIVYCKNYWGGRCAYCLDKSEELTKDHFVPQSKGGMNNVFNIVMACQKCNTKKSDSWPTVWCNKSQTNGILTYFRSLFIFFSRRGEMKSEYEKAYRRFNCYILGPRAITKSLHYGVTRYSQTKRTTNEQSKERHRVYRTIEDNLRKHQ